MSYIAFRYEEAFVSQNPIGQMIPSANGPRLKIGGGRLGGIDPEAIAKAEAALKSLSGNFAQWLQDEIGKLEAARQDVGAKGATAETMESLYLRAHDLKGLGATYGFPLITRIAGSLCRLIDDKDKRLQASMGLVDAHIQGIITAVRDDVKTDEDPAGRALVEGLESRVRAAGA